MKKLMNLFAAALVSLTTLLPANAGYMGWKTVNGKEYWYENGIRQGRKGDPKNIWDTVYGIERGREIYDPESDAWYWLDAAYAGAKAVNKEVWLPYVFQDDVANGRHKEGKWVRYDDEGHMIKYAFWSGDGMYYYDGLTGAMHKGTYLMDWNFPSPENTFYFDEVTGILQKMVGTHFVNQTLAEADASFSKLSGYPWYTSMHRMPDGTVFYVQVPFSNQISK